MANRFGRAQRKAGKTVAQKRRLTILPKADRLWLLAGTAIITGAVMWPTHPAFAACTPPSPATGASFECVTPETTPQEFDPDTTFTVKIGDEDIILGDEDGSIDVTVGAGAGLDIDASGNSGTVDVYDGSFISTTVTGENGLDVDIFSDLDITVHGADAGAPTDADAYIFGDGNGISATNGFELDIFNNGEIVGQSGDGISISNIDSGGVEIYNNGFSEGEDIVSDIFHGGLIAGGVNGIDIDGVVDGGDVYIGNNGYWTEDTLLNDVDVVDGLAFREGGLIYGQGVGGTAAGIRITNFEDNVWIENHNTLSSDASPFDHEGTLVLPTIDGVPVNAGIWGNEYGIYIDGDSGGNEDGRFVGINNTNGLIVGAHNDGIHLQTIGEDTSPGEDAVNIYNGNGGIITASESGSGINGSDIRGFVYIDNGGLPAAFTNIFPGAVEDLGPGTIGEDGTGFGGGYIVGDADGIELHGVEDGVWIDNARGEIWGLGTTAGGTGIEITNVTRDEAGEDGYAVVANGFNTASEDQLWVGDGGYLNPWNPISDGGLVFGDGRAITIANAIQAGIYNGEGGFILGEGFVSTENDLLSTPVIFLNTSPEGNLGEDRVPLPLGGFEDVTWNQASAEIVNYGIMGSYFLPHLQIQDFAEVGPGEVPEWSFDPEAFRDDVAGLQDYIWNGGSTSQLDGFIAPETALGDMDTDYQTAAGALLLTNITPSEEDIPDGFPVDFFEFSGGVDLYNFDTMFGRIIVQGSNEDEFGEDRASGNLIQNEGLWVVRDDPELGELGIAAFLNSGFNSGEDLIVNNGHIQTALNPEADETATFVADAFIQGSSFLKYQEAYRYPLISGEDSLEPEITPRSGLLSMIDGDEGDLVTIQGAFVGAEDVLFGAFGNEDAFEGFKSYVAMDVFLQDQDAYDLDILNSGRASDFLSIEPGILSMGTAAFGETGLIFRKTNEDPIPTVGPAEIQVVNLDGFNNGEDCGQWCQEGDTFFIASQSDGYFESVEGVGFMSDGLKAWGLIQVPDGSPGEDWYLVTAEDFGSPGAINSPKVGTGALGIADEIFDVVYDHSYGNQFRPGGGGGADLPVEAQVYEAPAASGGTQTGLWAKVTGSQTDRDDEFTADGLTFDTDYDQDIYTILGGADFKWDPNSPFRIGLFGGYVKSTMDFALGDGDVDYEGGAVGTYLAYNNGAFYADATVKAEFLTNDYSFDGIDVSADSTSVGVSANTGYRFAMGNSFVEPLASVRYVHVSIDDFDTTDGSVDYSDPDSLKAGVGARIGTAFATGGATTELSLLGRVWNEFEGETEVTVDNGVNTLTYSDDISGVYGEIEGQLLVTSSDGTLSGFVSANGKFGDDFTSYGAKAGVRKGF